MRASWLSVLLCGAALLTACGDDALRCDTDGGLCASATPATDGGSDAGFEQSAALYRGDALLDVQVTLSPSDWDALRTEGRNLDDNFSGCQSKDFDYTLKPASVVIDGQTLSKVAVRKKGFLGSISARKPSLRIELDEYVPGQNLLGQKTLILNNNMTDPSLVRQCMGYTAFRAAGVPAPRCSFARVTVNGQVLGIYTHVEPIKKPFLRRVFGEDQGNLYEGSSPADFRSELLENFEKKTNEADPAKPELEALTALLLKPDDELLLGLDALVDVEEFIRFWATESLIADWDSYSSSLNNFYVYADARTKKLKFLPWGPDDAFTPNPVLLSRPAGTPQAVYATSRLSGRLYKIAATRERFRQALRDQLAQTWKEDALLAEVDRLAALFGDAGNTTALERQREFIRARRAVLQGELDAAPVPWPIPEREKRICDPSLVTSISGTFNTTWGTVSAPTADPQNTLTLFGMPEAPMYALAGVGAASQPTTLANSTLLLTLVQPDSSLLVLQYQVGLSPLSAQTVNLHAFETFGVLLTGPDAMHLKVIGFVGEGSITFTQAASTPGAVVTGSFSGKWVGVPPPTTMTPP